MFKVKKVAVAVASALALTVVSIEPTLAASVIDANVTGQMSDAQADQLAIGALVITSAGIAFAINWVKATFF